MEKTCLLFWKIAVYNIGSFVYFALWAIIGSFESRVGDISGYSPYPILAGAFLVGTLAFKYMPQVEKYSTSEILSLGLGIVIYIYVGGWILSGAGIYHRNGFNPFYPDLATAAFWIFLATIGGWCIAGFVSIIRIRNQPKRSSEKA